MSLFFIGFICGVAACALLVYGCVLGVNYSIGQIVRRECGE